MGKKHFIPDILKPLKLYSSDSSLNGMYMGCEIRIYFPLKTSQVCFLLTDIWLSVVNFLVCFSMSLEELTYSI